MERNIALLIDFENIAAGTEKEGLGKFAIDKIISRIKDKGRILIARSYADWGRFARFKQGLLAQNVTMYELTSHGMQDKNRADIAMVVDCLELAYTRDYVDTYVVVSGDSDFTPLVLKLRELNKHVIGIGTRRSTSRLIINACDEFIFYDSIVQKKERKPRSSGKMPKNVAKAFEFLADVLDGMQREDPTPPHASVLKSSMLRRMPDFSESDLGFGSFTRFLEAARDANIVLLSRDKKSGGYTVDAVEEPDEDDAPVEEKKTERKAAAKSDDGAYDDPHFPEGTETIVSTLNGQGLGALSAPTRMTLLEALVEAEAERKGKRRRVNIPFMQEDLQKRLRRTHPEMSSNHIRAVLRGLMRAGVLMHKDGSPIRSVSAQFMLEKDAAQLNRAVAELYLATLKEQGADISDAALLADYLFGDRDRAKEVEEIVAWLQVPRDDADDEAPAKKAPAKSSRSRKAKADDDGDDEATSTPADTDLDIDALLVSDDDAEEAPKPKPKRRTRKKKPAAEAAPTAEDEAPADEAKAAEPEPAPEAPADEAPAAEAKAEPEAPADEAKAEDEAPKKKPTRRRTTRKKKPAEDEASATDEAKADED